MVGIDIVQNSRIESALERFGDRFLRRIFTERELEYCLSQEAKVPCLSARWACKEAVLKAVYIEFGILLRFREIEILGDRGKPARVVLKREDCRELLKGRRIEISLSHERDYSVAVAFIR